jgi:hypothetical protein
VGGGIEAAPELAVARRLQRGRREPHHREEGEPGDREPQGNPLWRTKNEGDGGRGLREHRRPDHEARETRVGPGVSGEASAPDAGEEGVMHDLDEPDDAYHDEGHREVDEEHQFQRGSDIPAEEKVSGGEARERRALDLRLPESVAAEQERRAS